MFWILFGSIASILFCLILHYVQHFRLTKCYKPGKSFITNAPTNSQMHINRLSQPRRSIINIASSDSIRNLNKKASWHCCLIAVENKKFDFYVLGFLLYMLFVLLVCVLITLKYIYIENNLSLETINTPLINVKFNKIDFSYHIISSYPTPLYITDWIIIYCIIIISSCESLFNFYRYFTIKFSSKYMHIPRPLYTMKHFSIYLIIFWIIFMIQIHFYYLLFPLVMCIYFGYNVYCSYSFSNIFVQQHRLSLPLIANDMIASVQLMRNISIFSCIISTICIGMFSMIKDINILYFLPLLWSISCIGYTLNFVRNREIVYETIFNSYSCVRYCQIEKIKFNMNFKRDSNSLSSTKRKIHQKNIDIIIHSIEDNINFGPYKQHQSTTATPVTPMTTPNATPMTTPNEPDIEIDLSVNCNNKNENNNNNNHISKPSKALILLGISNICMPNKNDKTIQSNKRHKNSYSVDFEYDVKSPSTNGNKSAGNTPMDEDDINDMNDPYDALENLETLQITIRGSSSEKVLNLSTKRQQPIGWKRKRSTSDPKITVSPTTTTNTNNLTPLSLNGSGSGSNNKKPVLTNNLSLTIPTPLSFNSKHISSLSHQSHQSEPSPNSMTKLSIENIKQSKSDDLTDLSNINVMELLVGLGFCSRKSWNSVQQLRQFQKIHNINK